MAFKFNFEVSWGSYAFYGNIIEIIISLLVKI